MFQRWRLRSHLRPPTRKEPCRECSNYQLCEAFNSYFRCVLCFETVPFFQMGEPAPIVLQFDPKIFSYDPETNEFTTLDEDAFNDALEAAGFVMSTGTFSQGSPLPTSMRPDTEEIPAMPSQQPTPQSTWPPVLIPTDTGSVTSTDPASNTVPMLGTLFSSPSHSIVADYAEKLYQHGEVVFLVQPCEYFDHHRFKCLYLVGSFPPKVMANRARASVTGVVDGPTQIEDQITIPASYMPLSMTRVFAQLYFRLGSCNSPEWWAMQYDYEWSQRAAAECMRAAAASWRSTSFAQYATDEAGRMLQYLRSNPSWGTLPMVNVPTVANILNSHSPTELGDFFGFAKAFWALAGAVEYAILPLRSLVSLSLTHAHTCSAISVASALCSIHSFCFFFFIGLASLCFFDTIDTIEIAPNNRSEAARIVEARYTATVSPQTVASSSYSFPASFVLAADEIHSLLDGLLLQQQLCGFRDRLVGLGFAREPRTAPPTLMARPRYVTPSLFGVGILWLLLLLLLFFAPFCW